MSRRSRTRKEGGAHLRQLNNPQEERPVAVVQIALDDPRHEQRLRLFAAATAAAVLLPRMELERVAPQAFEHLRRTRVAREEARHQERHELVLQMGAFGLQHAEERRRTKLTNREDSDAIRFPLHG